MMQQSSEEGEKIAKGTLPRVPFSPLILAPGTEEVEGYQGAVSATEFYGVVKNPVAR